jgi:glycosyltransferase involved in cell wall biosynthesis
MVWAAGLLLVITLVLGLETFFGTRRLGRLTEYPGFEAEGQAPKVSIVVPARNEERKIEPAIVSMLSQRYPRLEVVVVDDRSTDRTGAILDGLVEREPRLEAVHLRELPSGWLGKNHALQRGAERATGDWLLFADADVTMAPDAVSRAVRYAEEHRVDPWRCCQM